MFRDGPCEWRTVRNGRDEPREWRMFGTGGDEPHDWRMVGKGRDGHVTGEWLQKEKNRHAGCRHSRVQRPEIGLLGGAIWLIWQGNASK